MRPAHLLAVAAALTAALTPAGRALAQPGSGAPYGSRDAHKCTVPAPRGAPSPQQAAQAVVCTAEHDNGVGQLFLEENVRVQVGGGRPFQYGTDAFDDVDPSKPVYPIRGSYTRYACSTRQDAPSMGRDPNANCTAMDAPAATGICFTTTFGDLRCTLLDTHGRERRNVAPPRGAASASAYPPRDPMRPAAPVLVATARPAPRPPATPARPSDPAPRADVRAPTTHSTAYPAPDFSAMQPWYEVVNYEYRNIESFGHLDVTVRAKAGLPRPSVFNVKYLDASGLVVYETSFNAHVLEDPCQDDPCQTSAGTPSETKMPRVARVVVTRLKL